MSRGLGKLQRTILETLRDLRGGIPKKEFYIEMECRYWGAFVGQLFKGVQICNAEERSELNRRRASICQSLTKLRRRGLVDEWSAGLFITDKGREALNIKSINV
jgi:hypothetical protein